MKSLPTFALALAFVVTACTTKVVQVPGGTTPGQQVDASGNPIGTAPTAPTASGLDPISGVWSEDEDAQYIVIAVTADKQVQWIWMIDAQDGEIFPCSNYAYDGREIRWTYHVPSTGYTNHKRAWLTDPNHMKGDHTGSHTGEDTYERAK